MHQSKLESFRGKEILPIDRFPPDEISIMITSCPTVLAQIILRDKRIRELASHVAELDKEVLVQQNLLPDRDIPGD